jgi:hypothetical protein
MVPGRVGSFTPVHSGQDRQNTPGPGRVSHQTSSMDLDQTSREDEDEVHGDNEE